MTTHLGQHALVVGAGMGGLAAAAALSPHVARVTVIDRDALPDASEPRAGVGQGAHCHQLLKAGEAFLEDLLPGLTQSFLDAGAISMRVGRDISVFDFGGLMDECDAGFSVTSLSRPAYEAVLRAAVAAKGNVVFRPETPVRRFLVEDGRCVGVELEDGETLAADIVVDATGMTGPLAAQLVEDGYADYETEDVRINVAYASARFDKPAAYRGEQRGFFVLPAPPETHFGLMLPIEGDQWIISLGARGKTLPPRDHAAFLAYAKGFPTPDVYERLKDATPASDIRVFRKSAATRRLFPKAASWPDRLIPIGDAMSSVNPTYGQGMTAAAGAAHALAAVLAKRAASGASLDGVSADYLPAAWAVADRAWSLSINSDWVYPETEGERPATLPMSRAVASVLRKLSDDDLEFRVLRYKLVHMMDEGAALREGPLAIRFLTALQGSMAG